MGRMTRRGVGGKTVRARGVATDRKSYFMSYSEKLADRIREALIEVPKVKEKVMFSGVTFMVDDKMCISVGPDRIMCRIDPVLQDQLLEEKPCRVMVMKGREYKGYILVNEEDVQRKKELDFWIGLCLDFNARAKSSKKKVAAPAKKKPVANKKK
jgi:TfoX/Sxy family transcriptional regulator of competence genes